MPLRDHLPTRMMPAGDRERSPSRLSGSTSTMTDKPRRAAIYARFSSDLQDARSVMDQIELCVDHARRQHWVVAQVYTDEAISGATMHGRLALLRMVDD